MYIIIEQTIWENVIKSTFLWVELGFSLPTFLLHVAQCLSTQQPQTANVFLSVLLPANVFWVWVNRVSRYQTPTVYERNPAAVGRWRVWLQSHGLLSPMTLRSNIFCKASMPNGCRRKENHVPFDLWTNQLSEWPMFHGTGNPPISALSAWMDLFRETITAIYDISLACLISKGQQQQEDHGYLQETTCLWM